MTVNMHICVYMYIYICACVYSGRRGTFNCLAILTDQVLFSPHTTDFLSENFQNYSPAQPRSSVTLQCVSVFLMGKMKDGLITVSFFLLDKDVFLTQGKCILAA